MIDERVMLDTCLIHAVMRGSFLVFVGLLQVECLLLQLTLSLLLAFMLQLLLLLRLLEVLLLCPQLGQLCFLLRSLLRLVARVSVASERHALLGW